MQISSLGIQKPSRNVSLGEGTHFVLAQNQGEDGGAGRLPKWHCQNFGGFTRIFYKTILPTDVCIYSVYPEINLGTIYIQLRWSWELDFNYCLEGNSINHDVLVIYAKEVQ